MIYLDQITNMLHTAVQIDKHRPKNAVFFFQNLSFSQKCSAGSVLSQVNIFLWHEIG